MKSFLNKNVERQLLLLELIKISEEHTADSLAMTLGVDVKTISSDIIDINEIIYPIEIARSVLFNFYLKMPLTYNFEFIYTCFFQSTVEFQLLEKVFVDETYNYERMSEELFISISSLRRMIQRINKALMVDDFQIETNPLRIRGNERGIANFFLHLYIEKYSITDNYFSHFEQEILDHIIIKILNKRKISISFNYVETIKWIFFIKIIRMRNGNERNLADIDIESDDIFDLIKEIPHFLLKFKRVFKVEFSKELLKQAAFVLYDYKFSADLANLEFKMAENESVRKKVHSIEKLVTQLTNSFSLCMPPNELILSLYNLSAFFTTRPFILNNMPAFFLAEVEKKWPLFYLSIKKSYDTQSHILGEKNFTSFTYFLITEWSELTSYLSQNQKKMKVGLFYSTTVNHTKYVSEELLRHLSNQIEVEILSDGKNKITSKFEKDLIITNINNLKLKCPTICLSRDLTAKDLDKISYVYTKWVLNDI